MKVVEECHGKTWQKRCSNCDSLLEYEENDIYTVERDCGTRTNDKEIKRFIGYEIVHENVPVVQRLKCIRCPICGAQNTVGHIDLFPVIKGTYQPLTRLG